MAKFQNFSSHRKKVFAKGASFPEKKIVSKWESYSVTSQVCSSLCKYILIP